MNIPNRITLSRIFLIPFFIVFLLVDFHFPEVELLSVIIPLEHLIATAIFTIAAATDWLDGYYARRYKLITSFGKFLDPLADKLLTTAAFICFVQLHMFPAWMAIIIISREFAVTGIRLVAAGDGDVIAASSLGKIKTVFQMIAIISIMLHNVPFEQFSFPFSLCMAWLATIFTIVSGVDYFLKNKHVLLKSR